MKKNITAFIISHGHMDIEWYQPMHSYRFWLIEAMERQLALCAADPDTIPYTVDGQMFPIEEYLGVCPEKREAVRQLVQAGKLNIGPFFTQFDEWIPSGEAMVRNCLYGDRIARTLGRPMKVGYLPDNFGHPIQLPQILNGFAIDSLVFMRGMPYIDADFPDEFTYRGIDGSALTAVNFRDSYSHIFAATPDQLILLQRDMPYYPGYISFEGYLKLLTIDNPLKYAQAIIEYVRKVVKNFRSGIVPVVMGCDHAPPQVNLAQSIRLANEIQDEILFISGSPEEYIRLVQAAAADKPVLQQELLGTRFQYILLGALSTRSYLKRENFAAEVILEKYAEPLEAMASLHGGRSDGIRQLDEAWRLLMTNHAHDSIHGSSTDEVHTEMQARNGIIRQIGAGVAHNALSDLGRQAERWWDPEDTGILAFCPRQSNLPQFIDVWLPVGEGAVSIRAPGGSTCPAQILWRPEPETNELDLPTNKPNPARGVERVLIELPGQGTLTTVAMTAGTPEISNPFVIGPDCLENELILVRAEQALLHIYDKKEKIWYYGQNLLVETAECGDYWDSSPTWIPSEIVLSNRFGQTVEILEHGPVRAIMQVRIVMSVPARLVKGRRSPKRVDLPVTFDVTLYRGARRVEVALTLDNTALDHKISLLVEPQITAAAIRSQNAFALLQRPVRADPVPGACVQPPTSIFPFREWLAVEDNKKGLAIACRGLYDYMPEADPITGRTRVSLTLLRSVGNMNRMNTKMRQGSAAWNFAFPGGQCPGEERIEYAFIPYSVPEQGAFIDEAGSYLYPALGHVIRSEPAGIPGGIRENLFSWDAKNIVLSAFKRAYDGDGMILRLFENEGRETDVALTLTGFSEVSLSDLNENPGKHLKLSKGRLDLHFDPYKIITLLLA